LYGTIVLLALVGLVSGFAGVGLLGFESGEAKLPAHIK
jgi:hypothetical protein